MLPSEVPRLATDLPIRVFPVVWRRLSFLRLPSWDGSPSLSLFYLFLSFILFLPPLEDNGLLFWVPDVLCWHSEVVLWNLLSVTGISDNVISYSGAFRILSFMRQIGPKL